MRPRRRAAVARLLHSPGFRRLLAIRLIGQFGDGLLQVGLASFVFFSPQRAASPAAIAAGFAVLLLPFSIVGPFAGVLLDRWSRQRVLVIANRLRSLAMLGLAAMTAGGVANAAFYLLALVILGINRFILASLSAALPHVVRRRVLVTANSIAPTSGTVAALAGATFGVVIERVAGGGDPATAVVMVTAAAACLAAGTAATGFGRTSLGPLRAAEVTLRHGLADVGRGVVQGLRHLRRRPAATRALLLLTGHRFLYGVVTVLSILLFRNFLFPDDVDLAFLWLGTAVTAAGLGVLTGAVATPGATRRWGTRNWTAIVLTAAAIAQVTFGLTFRTWGMICGSFVLGLSAQAVKIGVDATLQRHVADEFRGRVFTLYDLLFNVAYVAAASVAALMLPADGHAPWVLVSISIGYLGLAAWYRSGLPQPAASA
ncbi:MAG TPA: MFS transporter [Actinomycetes bacterium]|nr:MFS transporter [Actinomycetes bacterium]